MSSIMKLKNAPAGSKVKLRALLGTEEMQCRLCEIGVTPETEITVLSNKKHCPIIIECRKAQVMLSRELSEFIEVEGG